MRRSTHTVQDEFARCVYTNPGLEASVAEDITKRRHKSTLTLPNSTVQFLLVVNDSRCVLGGLLTVTDYYKPMLQLVVFFY